MDKSSLSYQIFKKNPLAMIITKIGNGNIEAVNRSFLEKVGYSEEELLGNNVEGFNNIVDHKKLSIISKELKTQERLDSVDLSIRCKDGEILDGVFSIEKIDHKGRSLYLTTITDITEKIKLTKQLENKCQKFTNVVEGANLGTWEWNIKTGEIEINEKLASLLGYKLEELLPKTFDLWEKLVETEDLKQSMVLLKDHLQGESEYYDSEIRMKHKDGHWIWFEEKGKVVERDDKNKPLKLFGMFSDISQRKEIEKALKESEKRFLLTLDKTKAGLWDMNLITGEMYFSPMWKKILGYEEEEIENNYASWVKLWHPDEKEENQKILEGFFSGKVKEYSLKHRLKHKDGSWRWIQGRGGILKDKEGKAYRWLGTNVDISEEHKQALEFERVFSVNLDLLCITDMEVTFIKANNSWKEILGYSLDEIRGVRMLDFIHKDDREITLDMIKKLKDGKKIDLFISRFRDKYGKYHYLEWRANPYEGLVYAAARDITDRIHYEKKILEISNRDALTGVYNRRFVYERMEEIIEEYKRDKKIFSVSILDIDDFKLINDKYGHQIGDEVLKEFTRIIDSNLRPYDILGRYGGEEFIVVLNNADREESSKVLERILNIIREKTFIFNGNSIRFTFSAGVISSNQLLKDEIRLEKLIEAADTMMYKAKQTGKNKILYQE